MTQVPIKQSLLSKILFTDTKSSWTWLLIRLYVGYQWILAGWEKLIGGGWIGLHAGTPLIGFLNGALAKAAGAHPDVPSWYAWFLTSVIIPYPLIWSHVITFGELAVGLGLILGAFTGIAAFFGFFMNLNYLLAGTVSINPTLLVLSIGIVLAWRVAGYIGLDHYLLPYLGTPHKPGNAFKET